MIRRFFRGCYPVAFAGFACLAGCSGDDNAVPVPPVDASTDAAHEASVADAGDAGAHDGGAADSTASEAASDAATEASTDATADASGDGSTDGSTDAGGQ